MKKIPLVLAGVAAIVVPVVVAAPKPEPALPEGPGDEPLRTFDDVVAACRATARPAGPSSMRPPSSSTGCTPITPAGICGSARRHLSRLVTATRGNTTSSSGECSRNSDSR